MSTRRHTLTIAGVAVVEETGDAMIRLFTAGAQRSDRHLLAWAVRDRRGWYTYPQEGLRLRFTRGRTSAFAWVRGRARAAAIHLSASGGGP